MFTHIEMMCEAGVEDRIVSISPDPYRSSRFKNFHYMGEADTDRDLWSVGVVLLEVLLGSKLVLAGSGFDDTTSLFWTIQGYLDKQTSLIMQWLLFREAEIDPVDYVDNTLATYPEQIGRAHV
jgi:hypothetical protein